VRFVLNGRNVDVRAHPMKRLLDVLREDCGLTGTKEGCGEGECGACTILVDGEPVNSCLVPLAHVRGARVTTIEGLRGRGRALQEAFVAEGAAQCGFCTPGLVLAASALPDTATFDQVRAMLAGNICRCTGYGAVYRAIDRARQGAGAGRAGRGAGTGRAGRAGRGARARVSRRGGKPPGPSGAAATKRRRAGAARKGDA